MIIQSIHFFKILCKFVDLNAYGKRYCYLFFLWFNCLCLLFSSNYWSLFCKDEIVLCCTVFNRICSIFWWRLSVIYWVKYFYCVLFPSFAIGCQQFFYIPQMLSAELILIMYIVCLYSRRWLGMFGPWRVAWYIDGWCYSSGFWWRAFLAVFLHVHAP